MYHIVNITDGLTKDEAKKGQMKHNTKLARRLAEEIGKVDQVLTNNQ